jgi:hypothetical protein
LKGECDVEDDDMDESVYINVSQLNRMRIQTKKSVNDKFSSLKKKRTCGPADKVIFSPEGTEHYRHAGDDALSSLSSFEEYEPEIEKIEVESEKKKLFLSTPEPKKQEVMSDVQDGMRTPEKPKKIVCNFCLMFFLGF